MEFRKASEIQVGVIGYGGAFNMGKAHINEMKQAGMTPCAVCEIDKERLQAATADFPGIETYSSVAAMLKRSSVNLITIITPHNTHAKLALQCLNAGRSVVCEKPLAITTTECDAMLAAARKKHVVLSTYHNRHWDGCILNALKHQKSGTFGDIARISVQMGRQEKPGDWWRSSRSISGGILYDWGVHLLEYAFQLMRHTELVEVSGFARHGFWAESVHWKQDTIEDEAQAVVRFKNGAWLTLCITHLDAAPTPHWVKIVGTKATYSFDYRGFEIVRNDKADSFLQKGVNPESEHWRFYRNIADHLVKGEKLIITPEWSRRPIHVLDLAGQSARQGRSLMVKYS